MLISKFVRRLFSAEFARKRSVNSSQILSKFVVRDKFIQNARVRYQEKPQSTAQLSDSVLKFDDLKTIYQKQPKDQKLISYESFEEIPGIPVELLREMNSNKIFRPTEIQKQLLGHFFSSSKVDLLIKSYPGSGKSLGYVISLLADFCKLKDALRINSQPQSHDLERISFKYLIIVPSELLAKQLQNWIVVLSKAFKPAKPKISIICESAEEESIVGDAALDFLIATPETFRTKLAQGSIDINDVRLIVLDEADALIKPLKRYASSKQKEMRLKHPVASIVLLNELLNLFSRNKLLQRPRMIVASATLNRLTRDQLISAGIVKDPIFLEDKTMIIKSKVNSDFDNNNSVVHHHTLLKDPENPDELVDVLYKIVSKHLGKMGALFLPASQSKLGLCELLKSSPKFCNHTIGLLCNYYPKNLEQPNNQLLVASDVDCRGIDIPQLAYVIILDLPGSPDAYIHMSGRIGRKGQLNGGNVYTILGTAEDLKKFSSLLNLMSLQSIPLIE